MCDVVRGQPSEGGLRPRGVLHMIEVQQVILEDDASCEDGISMGSRTLRIEEWRRRSASRSLKQTIVGIKGLGWPQ